MSKPYGLSVDLRVQVPSRVQDQIWDVVEAAICAGMTPEQFKEEAAEAWVHSMKEQGEHARKVLR